MMDERYPARDYPKEYFGQKQREIKTFVIFAGGVFLFLVLVACIVSAIFSARGSRDYAVRMQQYYVEYSEEYDYWDVCTIEYPRVEGTDMDEDVAKKLNRRMYDTAMDRANYWHFEPNAQVRRLQEEEYQIYSDDVTCKVRHHSQYLLSVSYDEIYAPVDPVYYVNVTRRGLNVDLTTGEEYELPDVIRIDEDFVKFWVHKVNEEHGEIFPEDQETYDTLLNWFLGKKSDEEWNDLFRICPYFYMAQEKYFVIGIAVDPVTEYLTAQRPQRNYYDMLCEEEELEEFKRESEFWKKYDKAQSTGRVVECQDIHENLWLGDDASTWEYWGERGGY